MIGTRLSHFRIVNKLGEGGMGVVYRAEDERLHRPVALKVLPPEFVANEERRLRFLREARAAAAVSHPNITAVYDVGESEDIVFIAMELVEGKTLRELIGERPLPIKDALRIAGEMAEGLAHAHQARVIHRDLKPDNIIVRPEQHIKILDFGLAKLLEEHAADPTEEQSKLETSSGELTRAGRVLGTPAYMSPEQARGKLVDRRTDVWSFGCVLYELLSGRPAFKGQTVPDTLAAVLEREPDWQALPAATPARIQVLLRRCLRKDPEQRLSDLRGARVEIEEALEEISGGRVKRATGRARTRRAIHAIAVLPFVNASPDPDAEYLSDGITESIINSLSPLPRLRVMARSTVFRYKEEKVDPRMIGRELGVQAVLTGHVAQRGDSLVIGTELVDVEDGRHLWGELYNRRLPDIFVLQEEIGREICDKLRIKLTGMKKKRSGKRYTENTRAYQALLKGRFHWNKRTDEGMRRAIEFFEQAIEIDPSYALAYVGLADSYMMLGDYGALSQREAWPTTKAAVLKALDLDPALAEAHATVAPLLAFTEWDFTAAEKEFRRSIDLNPNYATARQWYASFHLARGHFEQAIAEIRRALEIDPLSLIVNTYLGTILYHARRYDQALDQLRHTLEIDAGFAQAHQVLARVYLQCGQCGEAVTEARRAVELSRGNPTPVAALAHALACAGRADEARDLLSELELSFKERYVPPYPVAKVYVALGDTDRAFAFLEKAYEERSGLLPFLNVEPIFDPLRSDPRLTDLVRRIGLVP